MKPSADRYRWLRALLGVFAILTGLLLVWVGWKWFELVSENVHTLPDTGGHWFEFLVVELVGIGLFILGWLTIAASIYASGQTSCFECSVDSLQTPNGVIASLVLIAGAAFPVLAVATVGVIALGRSILLVVQ